MEGLVDEILRDVLTRMGGVDWCVTEFIRVSDRLLPQSSFGKLAPELKNGALTRAGTPVRVQLLGSDPICLADNAAFACTLGAPAIDLNFGCPVPKVTRKGGGCAIPYKRRLYGNIVDAAVRAAEGSGIPITVKFRIGIDDEHQTHLDAGRIAAESGAAAVALHARTGAERYSGEAHWDEIARLVEHMDGTGVPVIGNGDIFAADDAAKMMELTGCHGVEVGRGCLGRPWLFAQLGAQLRGEDIPPEPTLGEVARIIYRHAELLAQHDGEEHACRDIRKHTGWYLRGFPVGGEFRKSLAQVTSLAELRERLAPIADSLELAEHADDARGRQGSAGKIALPEGWLEDPEDDTVPEGAEIENSGG